MAASFADPNINTKPPFGDADVTLATGGPIWGLVKFGIVNFIQGRITSTKWRTPTKLILIVAIHAFLIRQSISNFVDNRGPTLYDIFEVDRTADFKTLKEAKDKYLKRYEDIDEDDITG